MTERLTKLHIEHSQTVRKAQALAERINAMQAQLNPLVQRITELAKLIDEDEAETI